jgi:hypothetical protein
MSTLTHAAFLAVGVTLFAGAGGQAAPLPTNVAAMKSLAPQSTTEVRWGGVGWRGLGYRPWAGHGWGYHGWSGHHWGWGAAAPGAIVGDGYYGGAYRYRGNAGYPLYDAEYDDEDCAPYGGYYRGDYDW